MKQDGSYSDADLTDWERLPLPSKVLTQSAFGAWLMRRDEHRDKAMNLIPKSILEDIRAEIDGYCSDNRDRNDGLYIAMRIIDKHLHEIESEVEK